MSEIGNIADTNLDKLLEKVHLGNLDIVDLHTQMNDRMCQRSCWASSRLQRMIHQVRCGRHPMMGGVGNCICDGLVPGALPSFPLMGVVIVLIDYAHQLFTHLNILLIRTNF